MVKDASLRWAAVIIGFGALIGWAFLFGDQPIVASAVHGVKVTDPMVPSSCGSIDPTVVLSCKEECAKIGRCDAYKVSCRAPEPMECVCVNCA